MIIVLGNCYDEKNKLEKSFTNQSSFEGYLKDESSIINPVFVVEVTNPSDFNYMYIPEFGRYYFISDISSIRTNLWKISGMVDVLYSFADGIKTCPVTLSDTESTGYESYMSGDVWRTLVKAKTDIVNFQSGLNNSGEYILITSGG